MNLKDRKVAIFICREYSNDSFVNQQTFDHAQNDTKDTNEMVNNHKLRNKYGTISPSDSPKINMKKSEKDQTLEQSKGKRIIFKNQADLAPK